MPVPLTIIINHYRAPVALKTALKEIAANVTVPYEIIVVDSGAQKETGFMLRELYPDVHYIPFTENVGFAKSVNAGVKKARTPYVFIVNADLIVGKGCVENLLKIMEERHDVALSGPRLRSFDGVLQPSAFRYYTPLRILARRTPFGKTAWGKKILREFTIGEALREDLTVPLKADWLMGSALFVRASAIEKVGFLDERYFMYFEDVDWCRRFWEGGFQVLYVPYAEAYHLHKRASRGGILDIIMNRYTRIHLLSAAKYFKKFGTSAPRHGV